MVFAVRSLASPLQGRIDFVQFRDLSLEPSTSVDSSNMFQLQILGGWVHKASMSLAAASSVSDVLKPACNFDI